MKYVKWFLHPHYVMPHAVDEEGYIWFYGIGDRVMIREPQPEEQADTTNMNTPGITWFDTVGDCLAHWPDHEVKGRAMKGRVIWFDEAFKEALEDLT